MGLNADIWFLTCISVSSMCLGSTRCNVPGSRYIAHLIQVFVRHKADRADACSLEGNQLAGCLRLLPSAYFRRRSVPICVHIGLCKGELGLTGLVFHRQRHGREASLACALCSIPRRHAVLAVLWVPAAELAARSPRIVPSWRWSQPWCGPRQGCTNA